MPTDGIHILLRNERGPLPLLRWKLGENRTVRNSFYSLIVYMRESGFNHLPIELDQPCFPAKGNPKYPFQIYLSYIPSFEI